MTIYDHRRNTTRNRSHRGLPEAKTLQIGAVTRIQPEERWVTTKGGWSRNTTDPGRAKKRSPEAVGATGAGWNRVPGRKLP